MTIARLSYPPDGPVFVCRFRPTGSEVYLDCYGRTCHWVETHRRRSPGYFRVCDAPAALRDAGIIADRAPAVPASRRGHLALVR